MKYPKAADIRPGNWLNGLGEVVRTEQTADDVVFYNGKGENVSYHPADEVTTSVHWDDRKLLRVTNGVNDYGKRINGAVILLRNDGNYRNIDTGELYTCGRSIIWEAHDVTPVATKALNHLKYLHSTDLKYEELYPRV